MPIKDIRYQKIKSNEPLNQWVVTTPTATYPLPKKLGTFSEQGLEYDANDDSHHLISTHHIPEFLNYVAKAEFPWMQYKFSTLFYGSHHEPMPGLDSFLTTLNSNPTTNLDFHLILLARRAAEIQITQVGSDLNKPLCENSQDLLKLYNNLQANSNRFLNAIKAIGPLKSRRQFKELQTAEKAFQSEWKDLIAPYIEKYQHNADTRNVLLNLLGIVLVVGFLGLIIKNLYNILQHENLGLFKFNSTYSKNVEILEQLVPHSIFAKQSIDELSFFTANPEDSNHTIEEINGCIEKFKLIIDEYEPTLSATIESLRELHGSLEKTVATFSKAINEDNSNLNHDVSEAVFIDSLQDDLRIFFSTTDIRNYPNQVKTRLDDIRKLSELLTQERDSSERFKLYSPKT